ncbi:MAG: RluA family pseudouridine synthase [Armatimonadetes bacterium]|nr:RluA family pseudouridine synthase [Armatimonadota bacterium]
MDHLLEDAEEREYTVPAGLAGRRLDQAVAELAADLSRAAVQRLIAEGHCLLNGIGARPSERVREADRVLLSIPPPEPTDVAPEAIPLDVVHEDAHLIVINKPSGMVVHPAAGNPRGTLVNALLAHCTDLSGIGGEVRPGIVHRLDKETSGLLVAAKSDAAHRGLAEQIAERAAKRIYWALVWGEPRPAEGRVSAPIGRHPQQRQMMAVVPGGREAATRYRVLEAFPIGRDAGKAGRAASLVELNLETGRTHQIRVHMSHLGHPVLGDPLYGRQRPLPQSAPTPLREAVEALEGQALHARRLTFSHPVTGEPMDFQADPPEDFARVLEALRRTAETDR